MARVYNSLQIPIDLERLSGKNALIITDCAKMNVFRTARRRCRTISDLLMPSRPVIPVIGYPASNVFSVV